ncbi:MAG: 2Fe-2S iron-sulfur cluster-binding protein [Hydrotalea sp.]|nr:2Fe-2S iron-sulfur cluster-binding protein [Hydrotalea sp.]
MPKIIFLQKSGKIEVDAPLGLSVMEVATRNGVNMEATCEGSLACATCHVVLSPEWFEKLPKPSSDEEDMLDLAFNLTRTSRLACQIKVTPDMDGIVFTIPEM